MARGSLSSPYHSPPRSRRIPGHPFDLGDDWQRALADDEVAWYRVFEGYVAAVDWPTSLFWREIAAANPDALFLLSMHRYC